MILLGQVILLIVFGGLTTASGLTIRQLGQLDGWLWFARAPLTLALVVVGLIALFCFIVVLDCWVTGRHHRTAEFKFMLSKGFQHERVIVFLPGLGNVGSIVVQPLLPVLKHYGDVLTVNYPTHGYDQEALRAQLHTYLASYKRITIVGLSFGATMGADYLLHGSRSDDVDGFVVIDGPVNASDVATPIFRLAPYLQAGWVLSKAWPLLQRGFLAIQPAAPVEPKADRHLLKVHRDAAANFPASGYIGQGRQLYYNNWPEIPERKFLLLTAIIDCVGKDPLVKDETVKKWRRAFPNHIDVQGTQGHAPPVEEPDAMSTAVATGLRFIYPRP